MSDGQRNKNLKRAALVSLASNALLAAIKLPAGIIFASASVLSDAVNSLSDMGTALLVLLGLKISGAPADRCHNYGHEKLEAVFSTLLAMIVFITGVSLLKNCALQLLSGEESRLVPSPFLFIAAGFSAGFKEFLYRYIKRAAAKNSSQFLKAEAWHHRADAFSSLAVFVGLTVSAIFPQVRFAEQIVAAAVSLLLVKAAVSVYLDAINKLADRASDEATVKKMSEIVSRIEGVKRIDSLKTRISTYQIYVDIEIAAEGCLSLVKAHEIAQNVHDVLELKYTEFNIKHINVHVNPA